MNNILFVSRGILIEKKKILLIHNRTKVRDTYFVLPGGHLDPHESLEQAVIREFSEELDLCVRTENLIGCWGQVYCKEPYGKVEEKLFIFKVISDNLAEPKLCEEGLFPFWIDLDQIKNIDFRPYFLKDFLFFL